MSQTARQEVLEFISVNSVDMEDNSTAKELDLNLWSPAGKVWSATGCHTLSVHFWNDKPAGWKYLLEDVRLGLEDCEILDCEGC